jgi:hypothetical protein
LTEDGAGSIVDRAEVTTFPARDQARQPLPVSKAWVEDRLKHPDWVAAARTRLQSLSWFMKCKLALPDRGPPPAGFVA